MDEAQRVSERERANQKQVSKSQRDLMKTKQPARRVTRVGFIIAVAARITRRTAGSVSEISVSEGRASATGRAFLLLKNGHKNSTNDPSC